MLRCGADGALRSQEPEAVKAALKGMKFDAVYDLNGAPWPARRAHVGAALHGADAGP